MSGKIGIFDSGVGGLTTLRALRDALPTRDFHYLGDVARAPYGARGQDELRTYVREAVTYLRAQGCSLVIVACNTASTFAMKTLQEELRNERDDFRLLGILTPVVECALRTTHNNHIGVIATQSTVDSGKYPREVAKFRSDVTVYQEAAPTLASLIETNASEVQISTALTAAITPLLAHTIDTLVLGCTHYGHAAHIARDILPAHIALVHEGMCIADSLQNYLVGHSEFAKSLSTNETCVIETTKITDTFKEFAHRVEPYLNIPQVQL